MVTLRKLPNKKPKPYFERAFFTDSQKRKRASLTDYYEKSGKKYKRVEFVEERGMPVRKIVHDYSGAVPKYTEYVYNGARIVGKIHHSGSEESQYGEHKAIDPPTGINLRGTRLNRSYQEEALIKIAEHKTDEVVFANLRAYLKNNGFKNPLFADKNFLRNFAEVLTNVEPNFFDELTWKSLEDLASRISEFPESFIEGLGKKVDSFRNLINKNKYAFAKQLQYFLIEKRKQNLPNINIMVLLITGINLAKESRA